MRGRWLAGLGVVALGSACSALGTDDAMPEPVAAGVITGQIFADGEGPLGGAEVWLLGDTVRRQTDAEGRFEISEIPEGSYTLFALDGRGETPRALRRAAVRIGGETGVDLGALLLREAGTVEAQVLDADGMPLAGAAMTVAGLAEVGLSDAAGRVVLSGLAAGSWPVTLHYPGLHPRRLTAQVSAGAVVSLGSATLEPSAGAPLASLTGVIATGGVTAQLLDWQGREVAAVELREAGPYHLAGIAAGVYELRVTGPGRRPARVPHVSLFDVERLPGLYLPEGPPDCCAPAHLSKGNALPVAVLELELTEPVRTGDDVFADGSRSFDPDGDVLEFHWQVVGPEGEVVLPPGVDSDRMRIPIADAGEYKVHLRVKDSIEQGVPVIAEFHVSAANKPPVASLRADDGEGGELVNGARVLLGSQVYFDAAGSRDPDMGPAALSFAWALSPTDGASFVASPGQPARRRLLASAAGTYEVRVEVSDGEAQDTASFALTLEPGCLDSDGDGVPWFESLRCSEPVLDSDDATPLACADTDGDGCDDCSSGRFAPANDGADRDQDGLCDTGDPDRDGDGIPNAEDSDADDPWRCRDLDGDSCDDCSRGIPPSTDTDGADFDGDGLCDAGDPDDDDDGAPDDEDAHPRNPLVCGDADGDRCEDCSGGAGPDVAADGEDFDGDGLCDLGDPDDDGDDVPDDVDPRPWESRLCGDQDADQCDDCAIEGRFAPERDGRDIDGDGLCERGDDDDDGDGVADIDDPAPEDPRRCGDSERDGCDDCAVRGQSDPSDDGEDLDLDGICDLSDRDLDGDGVLNDRDVDPRDRMRCTDRDADSCDDCAVRGIADAGADGPDADRDDICDATDPEPDNPRVCGDSDSDSCDDCALGPWNPSNDGPDGDRDGLCDDGDPFTDCGCAARFDDPDGRSVCLNEMTAARCRDVDPGPGVCYQAVEPRPCRWECRELRWDTWNCVGCPEAICADTVPPAGVDHCVPGYDASRVMPRTCVTRRLELFVNSNPFSFCSDVSFRYGPCSGGCGATLFCRINGEGSFCDGPERVACTPDADDCLQETRVADPQCP